MYIRTCTVQNANRLFETDPLTPLFHQRMIRMEKVNGDCSRLGLVTSLFPYGMYNNDAPIHDTWEARRTEGRHGGTEGRAAALKLVPSEISNRPVTEPGKAGWKSFYFIVCTSRSMYIYTYIVAAYPTPQN